ncbi:SMODS domain-containing nucleotidyltransferase [Bacillus toyonensis]
MLSSNLVLSPVENVNITTSISTLSRRLNLYFNNGELHNHFQFGSSTRGTILPRRVDSNSDVDYMVVFKNPKGYTPETLLGCFCPSPRKGGTRATILYSSKESFRFKLVRISSLLMLLRISSIFTTVGDLLNS